MIKGFDWGSLFVSLLSTRETSRHQTQCRDRLLFIDIQKLPVMMKLLKMRTFRCVNNALSLTSHLIDARVSFDAVRHLKTLKIPQEILKVKVQKGKLNLVPHHLVRHRVPTSINNMLQNTTLRLNFRTTSQSNQLQRQ